MACRPGSRLRIDGAIRATASAVILDHGIAYVLTAGHACVAHINRRAEYFEGHEWKSLGVVVNALEDDTYDAGVIKVDQSVAVTRVPVGMTTALTSFPYLDLESLVNQSCESFLANADRRLTGTVTAVEFDGTDSHYIGVTPGENQAPGSNGDSGAPLIIDDAGQKRLAGIFVRLPPGQRVMRFLHPTPALNVMELPIP